MNLILIIKLLMNNVYVKIHFLTNVKVNINEKYKVNDDCLKILKKSNRNVLCKNFILMLVLLKLLKIITKIIFFTFPTNSRNHKSILRPPYKNKRSRHPIGFKKWHFIVSFILNNKHDLNFNSTKTVKYFMLTLKKLVCFFETSVATQRVLKIRFKFTLNKNFLFNKFN